MQPLEGDPVGGDHRFAVVVSRFNGEVTERLLEGCLRAFAEAGVPGSRLVVARVPGAFELPVAAARLARSGRFGAVVCLGAVIRGETDHYDHICREAAAGIAAVARDTGVPCVFGVLTADTDEQAEARAGGAHGNRGHDAARTAMEMADLLPRLDGAAGSGP